MATTKSVGQVCQMNHLTSRASSAETQQARRSTQVARSSLNETRALHSKAQTQRPMGGLQGHAETHRSWGRVPECNKKCPLRQRNGARVRTCNRQQELKKTVSAPPQASMTHLEHPQNHLNHLTKPQINRTNPRASSSRGREYLIRAATSDVPEPKRTCQDHLRTTRMLGTG